MYKETEGKLKIGFQFFAESSEGNGSGEGNNQGNGGNQNNSENGQNNSSKTFTQEEINVIMANEKRTARQALLKELGYDVKEGKFKDTVAAIKEILDSGKTQQQLDKEARETAETDLAAAQTENFSLKAQLDILKAGVKADYVDDVVTMLLPKVTEEKPLTKLLEEYKEKYPNWFENSRGSRGTGGFTNPASRRGGNTSGERGLRLAQSNKTPSQSSYFKN